MTADIELIEQALAIPEDSEKLHKKSNEKSDSTMVNTREITIMEKYQPKTLEDFHVIYLKLIEIL